jgi:hypothetical protein
MRKSQEDVGQTVLQVEGSKHKHSEQEGAWDF